MQDDDDMLGRCKAYRDGLAQVPGIDDQRFISHPLVCAEPRKGGEVVFIITGASQDVHPLAN
ncbi:hypothetical protein VC218_17965 [Xanthomonas nasturtii]|uniref:hypothetical protein n=1 Tax=Xanthomonas nasturtii TaxID=1843581 RepID=UPI002B22DDFD|nr:hypothetical protein [Xanthomonas nasturtii]MEA9580712.1 hypothetical protein [Xanthomonas nasturtii]